MGSQSIVAKGVSNYTNASAAESAGNSAAALTHAPTAFHHPCTPTPSLPFSPPPVAPQPVIAAVAAVAGSGKLCADDSEADNVSTPNTPSCRRSSELTRPDSWAGVNRTEGGGGAREPCAGSTTAAVMVCRYT